MDFTVRLGLRGLLQLVVTESAGLFVSGGFSSGWPRPQEGRSPPWHVCRHSRMRVGCRHVSAGPCSHSPSPAAGWLRGRSDGPCAPGRPCALAAGGWDWYAHGAGQPERRRPHGGLGVAAVFVSLGSVIWHGAARALEGQARRLPLPPCEFGVIHQKASGAQAPAPRPPAPA